MGQAEPNERPTIVNEENVHLRPFCVTDIPALVEIEQLSFTTPWTEEAFHNELSNNDLAHYTVVEVGNRVIAYCGMWLIVDEAHITNIAVHPQFRGKQIGEMLLTYVMAFAHLNGANKMTLEVRPSNETALNLYEKLGFEHKGTRPRYYQDDHEDAWIMWVSLHDNHIGH